MLSQGDIVLVPFPFTDEADSKLKPALVVALCERHQGDLLALISWKLNGPPYDNERGILQEQNNFAASGLKVLAVSADVDGQSWPSDLYGAA